MTLDDPLPLSPEGLFDFERTRGFARAYLRTYYAGPPQIDERLVSRFLVREAPRAGGRRAAEIGCGPTLHHALALAPHFEEIHLLDYLEENLAELRAWIACDPAAHDWSAFTRATLRDEGQDDGPRSVARREALLRVRIAALARCDLLRETPREERERFDLLGCFYCAEEVGITPPAFELVLRRVGERVAAGGTLLLACLADMERYQLRDAAGRTTHLPCARVDGDLLRELLPSMGFATADLVLEEHSIPQPDVGVQGIVLAAARKSPGRCR